METSSGGSRDLDVSMTLYVIYTDKMCTVYRLV